MNIRHCPKAWKKTRVVQGLALLVALAPGVAQATEQADWRHVTSIGTQDTCQAALRTPLPVATEASAGCDALAIM